MGIRKADIEDREKLNEIAHRSKAYWGYSKEFMQALKGDLEITNKDIQEKLVYVFEEYDVIQGFYCLAPGERKLEDLFIHPDYIGKGLGKVLWNDLIIKAKDHELDVFQLDSDPNAVQFYLRTGAYIIGERKSTVLPDRTFPLMEFKL